MTVPFVRFDPVSGEIVAHGVSELEDLPSQGVNVLVGSGLPATHYVANGALVAYTLEQVKAKLLRPYWGTRWCNTSLGWLDERTTDQCKADAAEENARQRRAAYPPIGDQLDALWHAMGAGVLPKVQPWYDAIAAVKAAHPKP